MSARGPLITGTVLTIGPATPLHLTRDLPLDYAQLATAPTGNGAGLFAVVAFIYAACLLVHGWRRHLRGGG